MAETRRFRVKRDHGAKGWKLGQEVSGDDLEDTEIEELRRQGVIEDAVTGQGQQSQGQRQGQPQPGGTTPGRDPQGGR